MTIYLGFSILRLLEIEWPQTLPPEAWNYTYGHQTQFCLLVFTDLFLKHMSECLSVYLAVSM